MQDAYAQMGWLINVMQGVTKAKVVQFWYNILDKDFRSHVQDIMLNQPTQLTLVWVFQVFECIEFNMIKEKVATFGFNKDNLKTSLACPSA